MAKAITFFMQKNVDETEVKGIDNTGLID